MSHFGRKGLCKHRPREFYGMSQKPLSLNQWLYGYANPILNMDPAGNTPEEPPLISPYRAKRIQQNLYNLGDPSKAPGWDKFVQKFHTQWEGADEMTWWQDLLCSHAPEYARTEIITAIMITKEFAGTLNDTFARGILSEAVGRQYWDNCPTNSSCDVSDDWSAPNAFLNFLSYDETMFNMTVTDVSLTFMNPAMEQTALDIAASIHNGIGTGGNYPTDHFIISAPIVPPDQVPHGWYNS